jgi:hypothetical protein
MDFDYLSTYIYIRVFHFFLFNIGYFLNYGYYKNHQ